MDGISDVADSAAAVLTEENIRADVAAMLPDADRLAATGGDLIACGLDSLSVMRLAARWRARGKQVRFADLMERPTLREWCALLATGDPVERAGPPLPEIDESEPFELAPMQYAYWVGRDETFALAGVTTHFYAEFDGSGVEPARLERAVRALARRHGMLRMRVLGDGTQQILPESGWRGLAVHDLRELPEAEVQRQLGEIRERLSHRTFAVADGEVFDLALSLLPGGHTRMHLDLDMIAADALSFRIMLRDLAACYAGEADLPPLEFSFPRYLAQRREEREQARERDREYWEERLPQLPGAPALPLAVAPERLDRHRVARRFATLSAQEREVLAGHAAEHGVTLPMVFAAAFCHVLAAWSEEPDFLLNVPLFDREPVHPDVDGLVGDFTNLLLVGVHAGSARTVPGLARQLQDRIREDAAHSGFTGLDVLRELTRARGLARQAVAPVVFTSAIGLGELFGDRIRECFGEAGWNISQAPQVWLDFQVTEQSGGLLLNWDAVEGLFAEGVLDAMFDGYVRLLRELLANRQWAEPVDSLLPAAQLARRAELGDTGGAERETVLGAGFFRAAQEDPSAPALCWGDREGWDRGELAARARTVSGLLAEHGVRPGDVVAITLPKGPQQIAAVLGAVHAGAVFVPVGRDLPPSRRHELYLDSGAAVVLGEAAEPGSPVPVVPVTAGAPERADRVPVDPESCAYLIYTSGSTGRPKGVRMSHRAARNTVEDIGDRAGIGAADRGLAVSALDHDWAVYDVFAFLDAGASLVVLDDGIRRDAHAWLDLVVGHRVTVWTSVPALLDMLLVVAEAAGQPLPLRIALVGGDWVGPDLWARLRALAPGARLVALGGATEVGIHSTWHEAGPPLPGWPSVPYGGPLRNQAIRVVDRLGRDCPDWVPGELWLGGTGVGLGYHGDPELTARRFVSHAGQRWYRTGDLVRLRPGGELEFLGRTDFQVKILGHRIELGEIEHALAALPEVARAVAVVDDRGDRPVLGAAVVPVAEAEVQPDELSAALARVLPDYLVPRRIVAVPALPLNANGKIDRRAVRELLGEEAPRDRGGPPSGPAELAVAEIWARLLNAERIERDDDFFALGGNSLLATRLLVALREAELGGAGLADLFAAPTLREFAQRLSPEETPAAAVLTADPEHRYDPFPATGVQWAYWVGRRAEFALGSVGSLWYWEFDGTGIDTAALERAWNTVVRRHDMLRAVFDDNGDQRVLPDVPETRIPVSHGESELAAMRERLSRRVFDPAVWPMFDLAVVEYGDGRARLGVGLDFLVLDALSIMTVFAELAQLYADPDAQLPPIGVSFRDCVLGGAPDPRKREEDREWWLERLETLPAAPRLPAVASAAPAGPEAFTRREFRLSERQWQRMSRTAARHGVTPSTAVLAAFATVLRHWSEERAATLNLTLFDRPPLHPDISRVVGDFTSLLLVADEPAVGESFRDAARRLQERVWTDMQHTAFSGIDVLRELARRSGGPSAAMPVVFTSTMGMGQLSASPFDLRMPFGEYCWGQSQTPQVWLDHQVSEYRGGLLLNWDVLETAFPPGLVDAMFAAYRELLHQLADDGADWSVAVRPQLPEAQRQRRAEVNATRGPLPEGLLHDGFLARAADRPERTAVCWGVDRSLSYGALRDRALRVAGALAARGVRAGDAVAVTLPKGPDQIAAVLGVLCAGGVYVPVGVSQPEIRRDRIYRTAEAKAVLAEAGAEAPPGCPVVLPEEIEAAPPLTEPVRRRPEDPAYVIFTSGSTGVPKGVVVAHQAALNTVADINDRFAVGAEDRVLAVSALDFDLSVYDIFGLLGAGGALVLPAEDERRDPGSWLDLARRRRVTLWNSVPALLDMLLAEAGGTPLPRSLRAALVSGDWVGLDLPGRLAASTGGRCRLVALGGATEAAIWSNAFEVSAPDPDWVSVPYGFPLRNQRFRVVGPDGEDRPDWVPGELWIGGAGVAEGYRGDPEQTAERFVRGDGERWYRTGDSGRYWPDGTLEFLGRTDHQVKVRGHRIELGEIEAVLSTHPAVRAAVAVDVRAAGVRLAAAVSLRPGETPPDAGELTEFLAGRLPGYMVPQWFEVLERLPLTANGKVDRAAVRAGLAEAEPAPAEPPSGPVETSVARLWSSLLGVESVGRHASFFALGGDSLLATRLLELTRTRFSVEITLRQLLGSPSVAEQARIIGELTERPVATVEEGVL
ncbi:amino acid adenylation domain-containing protein [Amycolatopsis albidoflavus]|uniref:Phenyloxazoline synthase MbtB n=9 Tax=Amycolatopsis TaxID=1813 RepID=A0ABW5I626_9PSEU